MKHSNRVRKALGPALGAALLAGPVALPAFAALGGDAASVDIDTARMKGQARVTPIAGYSVSEIQLSSGTVVREYVSSEGKVFAVSWHGPTMPDLQQTLGTYFEEFKASVAATRGNHHHVSVQQSDLVVSSGGHMRSWSGKAYVPSLLPPNFSPNEIH